MARPRRAPARVPESGCVRLRRRHAPRLVEVLTLQAGDVLAVQLEPRGRSDEQLATICGAIRRRVSDGVEVMVIEGAKIAVLRGGERA